MARAAPLSPDARRASIIAATVPLLRIHGAAVTTAQIALAAGIAEGTLFRVFPDKDSLVQAAIASAFDPAPLQRDLAQIDRAQPLRAILIAVVEAIQRRIEGVWQLMAMLGLQPPPMRAGGKGGPPGDVELGNAIAGLIAPHKAALRCEPAHAARLLRMMTFAGSHPRIADGPTLTAAEIVAVVLDGIRTRSDIDLEGTLHADPAPADLPAALPARARAGGRAAARRDDRDAVPAQPQRAHHRSRRRDR